MKKSYVREAMKQSPVIYRAQGTGRRGGGWTIQDQRVIRDRCLGVFLVNEWLPAVEHELEPTTYLSIRGAVENHILPGIGDTKIRNITTESLREFYRQLLGKRSPKGGGTLSKNTVIRVHAAIHRALESLVESGVLDKNPAKGARPRWRKSDRFEAMIWTPEELAAFLTAVVTNRLYALWHLLAWTGMRRGEAVALRWEDIHYRLRTVAVRRALAVAGGRLYLSAPKAAQSRVIALDPETIRVLRAHRSQLERERRRLGLRRASAHDYVFTDVKGAVLNPNAVSKAFARLVRATDLPEIRLHDLRHTHASHLIESGASIKAVQERLGHSDVVVTLNIYSHLLPTTQEKAIQNLRLFYRSN